MNYCHIFKILGKNLLGVHCVIYINSHKLILMIILMDLSILILGGSMPTSLPLFHLIIYMMESGMPVEKIEEDFALLNKIILQYSNTYLNHYETIKLLYPMYITNSPDIEYIEAYNSVYNFRLERTENSCKVVVENVVGYNGDAILSIRQEDIEKNN